ncbi:hypothetical protein [Hydrogenophaga sp. PBL-H3]|uniref:hypothetical protein n=1 Tax=Hydrogenophaga sp. PBL-H3 TaxID=434010 RepID=UPI00131F9929|nr:hypothetical protein [Hydrogenophaga sp. PBL-H3]QHE76892.1 hypothetical protein F9Z45_12940 [Hydrogenophaga sp. PBL-H3]QHE81316.1 hypothetical protein F9Z44_12940 [Hydrogenophaga sp. PBL-H3]
MTHDHTRLLVAMALALLAACDKPNETAPVATQDVAVPAPVADAGQPPVCGDDTVREILAEARRGLDAADRGDVDAYLSATAGLKGRPAACRPVLEQLQPIASRCSETEIQALMTGTRQFADAAATGNVQGFLASYDRIEQAVAPACWQAMHRHSHPVVVGACSADDLNRLAANAPELIRATIVAAISMDTNRMLQVQATTVSLMQSLPPSCLASIQGASRPQPNTSSASGGIPGVYDHGGGAYSVPGVAYCGASGCMAL